MFSFSKPRFGQAVKGGAAVRDPPLKRKYPETIDKLSAPHDNPGYISNNGPMRDSSKSPLQSPKANKKQDSLIPVASSINEVKSIFSRVDQVFKERKEDSVKLVWEISDLENQLEYLRCTTQEQCDATAAQAASMSMAQANAEKLHNSFENLRIEQFVPFQKEVADLKEQIEEDAVRQKVTRWRDISQSIMDSTAEIHEREERRREDIQASKEALLMAKAESEALSYMNEEAKKLRIEEQSTQLSLQIEADCLREGLLMLAEDRLSAQVIIDDFHDKRTALLSHSAATDSQIVALEMEANHFSTEMERRKQSRMLDIAQAVYFVQQSTLEEEFLRQRKESFFERKELCQSRLRETLDALELADQKLQELEVEDSSLTLEVSAVQDEYESEKRKVIELSARVEKSNKENELSYDLICAKLRDIKSFQQLEPLLKHEILQNEAKLKELETSLNNKIEERQNALKILMNQKVNLEYVLRGKEDEKKAKEEAEKDLCMKRDALVIEGERLSNELKLLQSSFNEQTLLNDRLREELNNIEMMKEDYDAKEALLQELYKISLEREDYLKALEDELLECEAKLLAPALLSEAAEIQIEREVNEEMEKFAAEWERLHGGEVRMMRECIAKLDEGIPEHAHQHLRDEIRDLEDSIAKIKAKKASKHHKQTQEQKLKLVKETTNDIHSNGMEDTRMSQEMEIRSSNFLTSFEKSATTSRWHSKFRSAAGNINQQQSAERNLNEGIKSYPTSHQTGNFKPLAGKLNPLGKNKKIDSFQSRRRSHSDASNNSLSKASLEDLFVDEDGSF